jgi:fibronectin-binding autotransporter adhesin
MKKSVTPKFIGISVALLMPLVVSAQTTFFYDTFTGGSTINSLTPANPTLNSTAYEQIANKSFSPTPTASGHLKFGIGSTTSGETQIQALFTNSPVALFQTGDYVQLTIVFTNTSGCLTAAGQLGVGLYNSGQVKPVPGGTNNATTSISLSGNAQNWVGYVGQINYTGSSSRIMTRPSNSSTSTGNNQDLITSGSSSYSYSGSATVGSTVASTVALTAGSTYTVVLYAALTDVNSVAVTNTLYAGAGTGGTQLAVFGGIATNTTFTTAAFDALAFGYNSKATTASNTLDIASIQVIGSVSAPTPPVIVTQPANVNVSSGNACDFNVSATGVALTYQWHRHGTNLIDGPNISGSTTSQLIISPASSADVAGTDANGYYCTITGAGNLSVNTTTNSLSIVNQQHLYYSGSGNWDLNTSLSWNTDDAADQANFFNFGDSVVFDDGGGGGTLNLVGNFLSASTVTVSHTSAFYTWNGTGSFAGPGKLIYNGNGQFNINNPNTYTGGTIISNSAANLHLGNAAGLGTGPVTLAKAGGTMEWTVGGGNTSGIGDVVVADDFTMQLDVFSTYAAVILGNISGNSGKTLTFTPNPSNTSTNERIRVYGTNTTCNANIAFNSSGNNLMSLAPYNASGQQTYNGVISGDGSIWQRGTATTILNAQNTYSAGTYPTTGNIGLGANSTPTSGTVTSGPIGTGPLYIAPESGSANGSGTILASGGARTIANALQYPTNNQILIVGGTNALTLAGSYSLKGLDGLVTNRTFQVNNTNAAVTISGVIDDAGSGCSFTKTGIGNLYLNGVNTYSGSTTNNSATATNSVGLGVLAGSGTIAGNVFIQSNSAIGGGNASGIGTLNIGGNLTINGNGWFRVNRSGSASDAVSVSGTIANVGTGIVTVTNLGTALQIGDTFTLFNKAVTGGAALTVTNIGGGIVWSNGLAVNGKISVFSFISSVTPITNSPAIQNITLSGSNVILTGTNGQTGGTAYLLMTTNLANSITTWKTVATNVLGGNAYTFTGTNVITPALGRQFYRLSSTNYNP